MKNLIVFGIVICSLATYVTAEESSISFEVSTDVVSKYVWRGQLLTDDPVVQPGLTISMGGFSLNIWGSLDVTDINESGPGVDVNDDWKLQELDYTLSYALDVTEDVSLEFGGIYYTFPGTELPDTAELYISLGLNVPLSPSLAVYYDIDEADGFYATLGLEHTFELTDALGLTISSSVGYGDSNYNEYYWADNGTGSAYDDGAFNDFNIAASLGYTVNENFSLSATIAYMKVMEGDMDETYGDEDVVTVGANATFTF